MLLGVATPSTDASDELQETSAIAQTIAITANNVAVISFTVLFMIKSSLFVNFDVYINNYTDHLNYITIIY